MRPAANAPSNAQAPACRYLDLDERASDDAEHLLSDDERVRAAQFRFAADRRRYVAAHAALRRALAEQTGVRPESLHFSYTAFGKPLLSRDWGVHFSLSHSHALGMIAVGRRGPLGADIEQLRPVPDALTLAARHFTPRENEALAALPAHERERAFLVCWTRKEACLKAIGLGLIVPPERIEVGVEPDCRSVEVRVADRILWLVLQAAPARLDAVASVAEWRQTHVRAGTAQSAAMEVCA